MTLYRAVDPKYGPNRDAVLTWVVPVDEPVYQGYAVKYDDPDCGGDYIGYFQKTLDEARAVVDDIRTDTKDQDPDHPEGCPVTIYGLVEIGDTDAV